jgi:8-oxo-dGTP diphosphatase
MKEETAHNLIEILDRWNICPKTGIDIDACLPYCDHKIPRYDLHFTPKITVDIVINHLPSGKIILVSRKNNPKGWALPGGFVDINETTMTAAIREAAEEVQVKLSNVQQFHAYSDPARDPRGHTISVVYTADTMEWPQAADDAKNIGWVCPKTYSIYRDTDSKDKVFEYLCFDHSRIIMDVIHYRRTGQKPTQE